jgi:hypothetical protein
LKRVVLAQDRDARARNLILHPWKGVLPVPDRNLKEIKPNLRVKKHPLRIKQDNCGSKGHPYRNKIYLFSGKM